MLSMNDSLPYSFLVIIIRFFLFVSYGCQLCDICERSHSSPYNVKHQARLPLVPFLTLLAWSSQGSNHRPPTPEEETLSLELSEL